MAIAARCLPSMFNLHGQIRCSLKFAATIAIRTHKVGIAKLAHGIGAIVFSSAPQIASRKTAKNGCTTGMRALAL
jgi:hypothetical protein